MGLGHARNPANRLLDHRRMLVPARERQQRIQVQVHPPPALPAHRRLGVASRAIRRIARPEHPAGRLRHRLHDRAGQLHHRAGQHLHRARSTGRGVARRLAPPVLLHRSHHRPSCPLGRSHPESSFRHPSITLPRLILVATYPHVYRHAQRLAVRCLRLTVVTREVRSLARGCDRCNVRRLTGLAANRTQ